jgi:hypothetical protein
MVLKEKDYQGGGADRPDRIHQVGICCVGGG